MEGSRFFRATALAVRLHLGDLPDHGPWDSSRIVYTDEREVDLMLPRMMMMQKVRTLEELDEALKVSEKALGSESLYVHEGLLDEAKSRWEEMHESVR